MKDLVYKGYKEDSDELIMGDLKQYPDGSISIICRENEEEHPIYKKSLQKPTGELDKNGTPIYFGDIVNDFGGGVMVSIEEPSEEGITTSNTGKYMQVGDPTRYGVVIESDIGGRQYIGVMTNPQVSGMDYPYVPTSELPLSQMEVVGNVFKNGDLMKLDTRTPEKDIKKQVADMRKKYKEELEKKEDWGYYLMSEDAIKTWTPELNSKHLTWDGKEVYIGYIDFNQFKIFYEELDKSYKQNFEIWIQEITDTKVNDFDIMELVTENLFEYIGDTFNASSRRNVCALIGGMARIFKMTPIDLFDYIHDNSQIENK